jgi:DNA-binding transcriptional LysR family regulator
MHLKFRQLEAFRAVVATGSTQLAADKMFVTQPAVSRLVKDLELELGFLLFDRSKGKLVLSEQGGQFFEALELHFLGLNRLSHAAQAIRQAKEEKLVLACSPVLSSTFLPACIRAIAGAYPSLLIEVHTAELASIRDMLQRGIVDLAVCLDFPVPPGVSRLQLGRVNAVCAMPDGHRLSKKRAVKLQDLQGERIIDWLPTSPFVTSQERDLLEAHDILTTSQIKTQTAQTRYALIAAGLGVSIAEPLTAKTWQKLGVTTRPLTPSVQFDYILAFQKSTVQTSLLPRVVDITMQAYQSFFRPLAGKTVLPKPSMRR